MEKLLIALSRVAGYGNSASKKAQSLLHWYNEHGELTKKQVKFARMLISRKPPPKSEKGKVYSLYAISDGINVKLGFSSNPKSRRRVLQTASSSELKLIWSLEIGDKRIDAEKVEKKLHRLCKKHRKRGEWFHKNCMVLVEQFTIRRKIDKETQNEWEELEIVYEANQRI